MTRRTIALVLALVVVAGLQPVRPAQACSCAEMTLDSVVERHPDAAVARVLRVDADGGQRGTGQVEQMIHGPQLPDELPLHLDDGGSCQPWVSVGEQAVLAFESDGGGWRLMTCGLLAASTGLDPIAADPQADDDPAAVVAGHLPGADLVALDEQLRVTSVGTTPTGGGQLHPCGRDVLVHGYDATGRLILSRLAVPSFERQGHYVPAFDPQLATGEVQDVVCRADGTVDLLLVQADAPEPQLHRDVFGEADVTSLQDTDTAAFVGDRVAFVQPTASGNGPQRLFTVDPATGQRRAVVQLPGERGELSVSPDGTHAVVRTFDEQPLALVVDLGAGEIVARSRGWWQPVTYPWVDDELLLLRDENSGGRDAGGRPAYRIVDLRLQEHADVAATLLWSPTVGGEQLLSTSSHGLTVVDSDGRLVRTRTAPWAGDAFGAVLLESVARDADAQLLVPAEARTQAAASGDEATPPVDPVGSPAASSDGGPPRWLPPVAVAVVLLAAAGTWRWRRRLGPAAPVTRPVTAPEE